tara:strand:- start:780 stop:1016 length:237 start_codon:yes stop_codon:yes gene_type:complete
MNNRISKCIIDNWSLESAGSILDDSEDILSFTNEAFESSLLSKEEIAKSNAAADYEPASVLLARIKKEKNHQTKDKKK